VYRIPAFRGDDHRVCLRSFRGQPAILPSKPFRLARQVDGPDLFELDGALGHQIVDVAIGRAGRFFER